MCCGGGEGMLRIWNKMGMHWIRKGRKKQKRVSCHKKKKGGDEDEGETEKELKNLPPLNAVRNVSNNDWNIRCGLRCESGDSHSSDWNLAS